MYTCANCKWCEKCPAPGKSDKVSKDGDSYAYYCESFVAKEGRTEAHKAGYTAIQGGVGGYDTVIIDDKLGRWVLHSHCTAHQTEHDLEELIDFYVELSAKGWGTMSEEGEEDDGNKGRRE